MNTLVASIVALALIAGFVALWYRTSPASGSGWAMFAAVVITLSVVGTATTLGVVVGGALVVGLGATWFKSRDKEHAGWLLFAAIVSALSMF
jgi:hypothetical protein